MYRHKARGESKPKEAGHIPDPEAIKELLRNAPNGLTPTLLAKKLNEVAVNGIRYSSFSVVKSINTIKGDVILVGEKNAARYFLSRPLVTKHTCAIAWSCEQLQIMSPYIKVKKNGNDTGRQSQSESEDDSEEL